MELTEQETRRRRRIGQRVKMLRMLTGDNQQELAAKAGLSRPFVTRIENGSVGAAAESYERLAEALGVRIGAILGNDDEPYLPDTNCEHCGRTQEHEATPLASHFGLKITGDSLTVQAGEGGSFIIRLRGEMLMVHAVPGANTNGVAE